MVSWIHDYDDDDDSNQLYLNCKIFRQISSKKTDTKYVNILTGRREKVFKEILRNCWSFIMCIYKIAKVSIIFYFLAKTT